MKYLISIHNPYLLQASSSSNPPITLTVKFEIIANIFSRVSLNWFDSTVYKPVFPVTVLFWEPLFLTSSMVCLGNHHFQSNSQLSNLRLISTSIKFNVGQVKGSFGTLRSQVQDRVLFFGTPLLLDPVLYIFENMRSVF